MLAVRRGRFLAGAIRSLFEALGVPARELAPDQFIDEIRRIQTRSFGKTNRNRVLQHIRPGVKGVFCAARALDFHRYGFGFNNTTPCVVTSENASCGGVKIRVPVAEKKVPAILWWLLPGGFPFVEKPARRLLRQRV